MQLHPVGIQIHHILEFAPALLGQVHNIAHIILGRNEADLHKRLLRQLDFHGVGVIQGIIHHHHLAGGLRDPVDNVGGGGNQVQIVLPLQPLLDDFHVQKTQESAAETKAQGDGAFQLVDEGRII